jgi:hypothetical protein
MSDVEPNPPTWVRTVADQREAKFQAWFDNYQHYIDAVIEGGGTPRPVEEIRETWFRRYTRPDPPVGLTNDPPWREHD